MLEELAHLHAVPRLMQEYRTLTKVLGDFVCTFAKRARRSSFGSPGTVGSICLSGAHLFLAVRFMQQVLSTQGTQFKNAAIQSAAFPSLMQPIAKQA